MQITRSTDETQKGPDGWFTGDVYIDAVAVPEATSTFAAALDYAAEGIRINAICPGIVDTEMMRRFTGDTDEGRAAVIAQEPVGRMGRPEEIAAAVLWLCSDEAAFTVGHAMVVDGGQTA